MSEEKPGYWERVSTQPFSEWFPFKAVALVLVGFALIIFYGPLGLPLKTDEVQAGFRGTGMATIYEREAYAAALRTVDAIPEDEPPYETLPDDDLARDFYENVQVLGDVSVDNFNRIMNAITAWVSPDQGCAYCHGEEGNFADDSYYPKIVARRMIQMTQAINSEWTSHVGATGVNCYTCHRGMNVPEYIWFNEPPETRGTGMLGWRNNQNMANPRVGSTSLPSNVFEKFLSEDNEIRVISPAALADETGQGVKDAEWTFGLMVHMSTGLGVNCAYCHNTRSMNVWEQGPPQRTTAWYGIRMARALNNEYLDPLQPVYPPHRLGPTGDAPKLNCSTCHQGVNKPLFGTPMIENWPELVGQGERQAAAR
ncbi:MAG: photosynthetic reaction center cytochrome PufC [Rubrimonas sp.]